jgi:Ni/Co efflux regulator RcnB
MKSAHVAIAFALALVTATTSVGAQDRQSNSRARADERSVQFDDHARQTTNVWYQQHQSKPPAGFRSQDRLSPDQESRLQPGRALDSDLRKRSHSVPRDLSRQLPQPPPNHKYVAIGGHVGLVDNVNHTLRDVIHVHK